MANRSGAATSSVPVAGLPAQGSEPVRIGILGCARIAPAAVLRPARKVPGAAVLAVGSRRLDRAQRWAGRHRVPRAYGSYDEVLDDPEIDAVYIPLPNGLHAHWSVRALEAGKHVLCEKPVAGSEREARDMARAAAASGLVAMEAFHYRHHPLFGRIAAIVASGELGDIKRVEAGLSVPLLRPRDIRWDPTLGGGAAMDVGCYAVNAVRTLVPGEPEVKTAAATLTRRGVDRSFTATLEFPRGVRGAVEGSILGLPRSRLAVTGTRGRLEVDNPFLPHLFYRLRVTVGGMERRERVAGQTTYIHQLAAFVAAVNGGTAPVTDFEDGARNMRVLDHIRSIVGVRARR